MRDISALVVDLEASQRKAGPTKTRRKTANVSSLQEWHDAAAAAMLEMGPQYRLETITEDKHFPRRTLGADEIRDIVNASESPDIGPPPVARFDEMEPVKFDPPAKRDSETEADELAGPLSINLETRRKRKDGQPRLDIRRLPVFQSPPADKEAAPETDPAQTQVLPIRAGAKRKLSARETDDKPGTATSNPETAREPFQFSRRTSSARTSEDSRVSERKALGAKSANVDVVNSPRKIMDKAEKKSGDADAVKAVRSSTSTVDRSLSERRVRRVGSLAEVPPSETVAVADIVLEPQSVPPKGLATPDLFSPISVDGLADMPQDTPEPGAVHSELLGTSRPGRRARSQLNYAEPSLNTKMRRPGKELADAVSKQGKPVAVRAQPRFKKDPDESATSGDEWKRLPSASSVVKSKEVEAMAEQNSPLRDKALSLSQALRDQKERDRLEAAQEAHLPTTEASLVDVTSDAAPGPAALTSIMRKRLGRPAQVLPASIANVAIEGMSEERRESLAIFDFSDSPPRDTATEKPARARGSRRHSSVPSLPLANELKDGGRDGLTRKPSAGAMVSRTAGNGVETSSMGADSLTAARRERAAGRRKSMML